MLILIGILLVILLLVAITALVLTPFAFRALFTLLLALILFLVVFLVGLFFVLIFLGRIFFVLLLLVALLATAVIPLATVTALIAVATLVAVLLATAVIALRLWLLLFFGAEQLNKPGKHTGEEARIFLHDGRRGRRIGLNHLNGGFFRTLDGRFTRRGEGFFHLSGLIQQLMAFNGVIGQLIGAESAQFEVRRFQVRAG